MRVERVAFKITPIINYYISYSCKWQAKRITYPN
jgi:hypothetical protein